MTSTAEPSTAERGARTRRRRPRRLIGVLAVVLLALGASVASPVGPASPAYAADYPTWDELQKAKSDTSAAKKAVANIKALIADLEVRLAEAIAEAERRAEELFAAQQAFDEASRRAEEIQKQAEESAAAAEEAERNAGQLAAQLYRTGGTDVGMNLFLEASSGGDTDMLLSKLGNMSKMVERTAAIYEQAQAAQNSAASLADQAAVAREEREKLRVLAEEALAAAQAAQAAAEAALAESQAKQIELDQQLKFMEDTQAKVTAAFEEGERKRKEEEERRRREAMQSGSPGTVAGSGWALPAGGWISGSFGPRPVICAGGYCSNSFHYAVDIATGCSAPLYAANSGVVTYAGWSGSYGNFVKIDHGGGISTGYAHIRPGGIFVGVGQWVGAGQNIASSGTTGASTGCHLHFEVYEGWNRIDPVSFMAARGVGIG